MINFDENIILLDDATKNEAILFQNPIEILTAFTKEEFFLALEKINKLKNTHYVVGYIRYEAYKCFHKVPVKTTKRPLLYFGVYDSSQQHNIDTPSTSEHSYIKCCPNISQKEYKKAFEKIKNEIEQGNTYQVNLTYDNDVKTSLSNEELYLYLRNKQGTQFGAYIKNSYDTVMSFSPELFFKIEGNKITTKPMKGTINRGENPDKDEQLKQFLRNDEKNRAENLMIVDLLRNDISKIAKSVKVKSIFDIETYDTIHQMTSTIKGELNTNNVKDWLSALFPCGSITGAPKINTMNIINEIEPNTRDIYCGAIGYFSPDKTIFSVPIRTLQKYDKLWSYNVGGGIVWDSEVQSEWDESRLKSAFVDKQPDFKLIETMLVKDGKITFEDAHIKRLKKSAEFWGYEFSWMETKNLNDGILRIALSQNGNVELQQKELETLSNKIRLSKINTDSNNELLYHKTDYRPWYNVNLDGIFDEIFINEKGEVTEGARSNVFIKKDNTLYTPPTSSGLLNGILRQELINNGDCKEKILYVDDLMSADEIYCGNSVRGLVQVYL